MHIVLSLFPFQKETWNTNLSFYRLMCVIIICIYKLVSSKYNVVKYHLNLVHMRVCAFQNQKPVTYLTIIAMLFSFSYWQRFKWYGLCSLLLNNNIINISQEKRYVFKWKPFQISCALFVIKVMLFCNWFKYLIYHKIIKYCI